MPSDPVQPKPTPTFKATRPPGETGDTYNSEWVAGGAPVPTPDPRPEYTYLKPNAPLASGRISLTYLPKPDNFDGAWPVGYVVKWKAWDYQTEDGTLGGRNPHKDGSFTVSFADMHAKQINSLLLGIDGGTAVPTVAVQVCYDIDGGLCSDVAYRWAGPSTLCGADDAYPLQMLNPVGYSYGDCVPAGPARPLDGVPDAPRLDQLLGTVLESGGYAIGDGKVRPVVR